MPATTYSQLGSGTGLIHICDAADVVLRSVPNIAQTVNYITGYNLWKKTTKVWLDCEGTPVPGTIQGGGDPALDITDLIQIDRLNALNPAVNIKNFIMIAPFDGAAVSLPQSAQFNGTIIGLEGTVFEAVDPANAGKVEVWIDGVSATTSAATFPANAPVGNQQSATIDTTNCTFTDTQSLVIKTDNVATSGKVLVKIICLIDVTP